MNGLHYLCNLYDWWNFVPMYQNQLMEECNYIVNNSQIKLLFCNDFKKYSSCVNKIDSKNLDNIFLIMMNILIISIII